MIFIAGDFAALRRWQLGNDRFQSQRSLSQHHPEWLPNDTVVVVVRSSSRLGDADTDAQPTDARPVAEQPQQYESVRGRL